MADTDRIKRNLGKMMAAAAPETDMDAYLKTEGFNSAEEWRAASQPRPLSQVPGEAAGNFGKSAAQFASDVVQPILHPIDTAKALGAVTRGLEAPMTNERVTLPNGQTVYQPKPVQETPQQTAERTAPADAVGQHYKDRYGGWENIKKTIATDPVGFLADASVPLTLGGSAPVKGAQIAGKVGAMIDPLSATGSLAKTLVKYGAEPLASNALGLSTGAGRDAVRTAGRAGLEGNETFVSNMRGTAPANQAVDMAKAGLTEARKERGAGYNSGMVDIKNDKTFLGYENINKALDDAEGIVKSEGGAIKSESAADVLDKMRSKVGEFQNAPAKGTGLPDDPIVAPHYTASGLDELKQAIGAIREKTQPGTRDRLVADSVYNAIKDDIVKQAPVYAEVMADYSKASDQIGEVERTFSLGKRSTDDAALRKLQSVMRNNANTNYGGRKEILAEVLAKHQPDLPYALAGQALNVPTPRGLASQGAGLSGAGAALHFMDPLLAASLLSTSPRLVGEVTYAGGRAAAGVGNLADTLAINAPNVRAAGQGAYQVGRGEREADTRALALALRQMSERRGVR